MAEVISPFGQSLLGRTGFSPISEGDDAPWRHQYYNQLPALTAQWPQTSGPGMSGIQQLDVNMWSNNAPHYQPAYSGAYQPALTSPHMGYSRHDAWSDMEVGTPSSTGFASDIGDSYPTTLPPAPTMNSHLHPQSKGHRASGSTHHSPRSSYSGLSEREIPKSSPQPTNRPSLPGRSISDMVDGRSVAVKHAVTSDEEDGEFVPSTDPKTRGRKRQRIPHTAVERRYRENLNAHLDKLRQTVPTLAARKGPGAGKGEGGEGVRPSKCEILSGAIDHISTLDRDNAALRNEVARLRAQVGETDGWYHRPSSH